MFSTKKTLLNKASILSNTFVQDTEKHFFMNIGELHNTHKYVLKNYITNARQQSQTISANPYNLAIVIPYRLREPHRDIFIPYMNKYFEEHAINATLYLVHQKDDLPFNRGTLKNIGFQLTATQHTHTCFHDIDWLPKNTTYAGMNFPVGLSYNDCPLGMFGGVVLFENSIFQSINGCSNQYWGYGWEDVDLRDRCLIKGLPILRPTDSEFELLPHPHSSTRTADGTYHTDNAILKQLHQQRRKNRKHYVSFANGNSDPSIDGLNSVDYTLLERVIHTGYIEFCVTLK